MEHNRGSEVDLTYMMISSLQRGQDNTREKVFSTHGARKTNCIS